MGLPLCWLGEEGGWVGLLKGGGLKHSCVLNWKHLFVCLISMANSKWSISLPPCPRPYCYWDLP